MKTKLFLVAVLLGVGGFVAAEWWPERVEAAAASAAGNPATIYRCPMHPWVGSDHAGRCTICGMDLVQQKACAAPETRSIDGLLHLSYASVAALNVQTAVVKKQPLVHTLRVAGLIGEDESRHGIISAPVEGRLDGLAMNCDGLEIHVDQPYAVIFSQTLLDAASAYLQALKTGGATLAAAARLREDGLVEQQIAAVPTRQADDIHFGLLATMSGTVVKSYVNEGQYVRKGETLFEIADFSRMWFKFNASEQDLPFIHKDQMIEISTPSLPGETLKAKITFISPNLDAATHLVAVRVVLENKERRLKNNVYAEGILMADAEIVLAVPRSAVLWPGKSPCVFVEKASGIYEPREVKLGRASDDAWEVLDGLAENERVVVSGNILLDGQAQLNNGVSNERCAMKK